MEYSLREALSVHCYLKNKRLFIGIFLLALLIVFVPAAQGQEKNPSENISSSFVRTVTTDIAQKKLKTIIVDNYYPYTFMNEKGLPDGFSVDLIKAVTTVMGMDIEISAGRWDDAQQALAQGKIDLLPMMAYSRKRDAKFDFYAPHTIAFDAFFVRKDAKPISSVTQLAKLDDKSIIVMNGDAAHNYLLSSGLVKTSQLILVDSLPAALRLLAAGTGDTAIMPKIVGTLNVKKLNLTNIEPSPAVIEAYSRPFSLAVKEGNQDLLERLSQGLLIVKQTGDYEKIYEKWFGAREPREASLRKVLIYIFGIGTVIVIITLIFLFWSLSLKRKVKLRTQHLEREMAERKKAEEELRESEVHFRTLFNSGQALIWMAGVDKQFEYINQPWLEFTGRTLTQELGDGWTKGVHPDDLDRCRESYTDAFDRRGKFTRTYRLRRHDGEYRWIQDDGTPRFNRSGEFIGYIGHCLDVTDLLQMEEDIKESEKHFRAAFYTNPDSININRLEDGLYVDINEGFTRLTGYTRGDIIDKTCREINLWSNTDDREKILRCLRENGYFRNMEAEFRRKDGSAITVLISARVIKLQNVLHILSNTRDITERRQAEKRQELVNRVLGIIHADTEGMESITKSILLIKELTGLEAVGLRLREGEEYPYFAASGFADYFVQAENYLCSRNEKNEIIRDTKDKPCLECMCGNVIQKRIDTSKPFFTKGGSFWTNNMTKLLASTTDQYTQTMTRLRCKSAGYESVALIPLRYADKTIGLLQCSDKRTDCFTLETIENLEGIASIGAIAINRRRTEIKLRAEEERYRTVANFTYDWEYWIAADGRYQYVSPSFQRITGYNITELTNNINFLATLIHPDDRSRVTEHISDPGQHPCPFDFRIITNKGEERWIGHRCQQVFNDKGNSIGWRGSNRDITERKKMEEHIRQSQKMEAIGTLAGGIAHDFNNILGAIMGYAAMAQEDLPEGSSTRECVDEIWEASERAKFLVQQILAFSRHAQTEVKPLMIGPIVKEVVKLLRHALPSTIKVKQQINVKSTLILADATHIHQILMNLCTNAGHAMHENGGTLTISLNQIEITSDYLPGHEPMAAGNYLELKVTDTGHGIDPAIINRIFDPFFTTKQQGQGTGMGLAVVYGIVHGYGGHIDVASKVGVGTTFTIYFSVPPEQIIPTRDKVIKLPPLGRERIMVVEDQGYLLTMMKKMLSRLGYAVTAIQNPLEAWTMFTTDPSAWDMIITDQTMPDLTGCAMAQKMLNVRPDIPIILCTGFSDLVSAQEAKAMGIREYLQKPIALGDLSQAIRDIFDNDTGEKSED
ncbi:MAG: hypothetical protein CVU52_02435 [Deltaproteobacteria bacterium HGW-Deltaproteobacteria-10]|nr:MAG: hypothetical protein CVU52_02435 [Deltaproteobacteria bacterium HGW-Deltaproteobacteria-10]